jgi:hypothetical protein
MFIILWVAQGSCGEVWKQIMSPICSVFGSMIFIAITLPTGSVGSMLPVKTMK